ncbi:Tn3 family transposase [Candidatus Sororendozoicomonas aggregata]|uniref:Tn3 family transposase n=1 Tax=Candidatus Sororendozoicomonas aggregata TaxID=3073239 RepID=UPI002ED45935
MTKVFFTPATVLPLVLYTDLNFPSDRLAKAFTNLGRIIKTEYILRYITDNDLRRIVQF